MFLRLLLPFFIAFSPALDAQSLHFTLTGATMNAPGNRAVLVSNQYGVLRYVKLMEKGSAKEETLTFDVQQRLGERLSLTLVREVDGGGIYGFENTTFSNLVDGAVIDMPAPERAGAEYREVEFIISGVSGVEEVVVLSPLEDGAEYRIDRQRLLLSFRALDEADIFVLFRLKGQEDYLYYYGPMQQANRIEMDVSGLKGGLLQHEISLPATQSWDGHIKGYHKGSDKPCYLFNSIQQKAVSPRQRIRAYLPPGLEWEYFGLVLSNLGSDQYGFYNRYEKSLPAALGELSFDPLLTGHQSKAFRFQTTEQETGQFYAVSYAYGLLNKMPAKWQIYGLVEQPGEVDFILPDLPDGLLNMLPELQILSQPAAITKSLFRCARCESYDFRLAPAKLLQLSWRLENGLLERGQWLEF